MVKNTAATLQRIGHNMAITTQFLLDTKELRKLLAQVLTLTPERVIQANTQVDTNTWDTYATVLQLTAQPNGTGIKFDGDAEMEYAQTQYNVLYSVQLIGKDAIQMANRSIPVFSMNSIQNELKRLKIGILQISAVRAVPIAIDGGYEERAQFDLFVSQYTIVREQLNAVTSVEIQLNTEQ